MNAATSKAPSPRTLHVIGVFSGIAAGVWLGSAAAPNQLVTLDISPFVISVAMVIGVFVARWTLPTLLKGTTYVFADLKMMPHLIIWALLAGALWGVANTLTVFAIKDIGLAIAFPIWNSNCVVGLLWGCLLFNELKGAENKQWLKVGGGVLSIIVAMIILAVVTTATGVTTGAAFHGVLAALGAGLLWGTMYIPYRKAYLSGMNPLSFVTMFTFGEVITVVILGIIFLGGVKPLTHHVMLASPILFWVFLGGFFWVVGDLFQQFAAKYIGIGRGIPLANTNQLWGLAWAALVYRTFDHLGIGAIVTIIAGCLIMIAGAALIASAEASDEEQDHWANTIEKECKRYNLDKEHVFEAIKGGDPLAAHGHKHRWWDILIVIVAIGIFIALAFTAHVPQMVIDYFWLIILCICALVSMVVVGWLLHKHTGFS
jgi:glucose uptake protein GlcU